MDIPSVEKPKINFGQAMEIMRTRKERLEANEKPDEIDKIELENIKRILERLDEKGYLIY